LTFFEDTTLCRFLADLLISYFQSAIASVLTDGVTKADILSSHEKLLLSYVKPDPIFEERKNSARALGPCLHGSALGKAGQDGWKLSSALDGFLLGVRGKAPMAITINATDAEIGGASAWLDAPSEVQLKCLSGSLPSCS
jgi:hypothetical protein